MFTSTTLQEGLVLMVANLIVYSYSGLISLLFKLFERNRPFRNQDFKYNARELGLIGNFRTVIIVPAYKAGPGLR